MAATTLAGAFAQGVDASKPAASSALEGYFYFSTDINGGTLYQCKSSAWVQQTTGVTAVKPNGLTGATATVRLAGGTTSGAPVSGTFAVGDIVADHTGPLWQCTVAGTPGTWVAASGGGVTSLTGTANEIIASGSTGAVTLSTPQAIGTVSSPTFASLALGGLTGAVAGGRFVGFVASGAPASGTFLTDDLSFDIAGNKWWLCTSGGTPGTWVASGGGGGGGTTSLLLDYAAATDIASPLSLTAATWTDLIANQSFTVTDATKRIVVSVSGDAGVGTTAGNTGSRIVLDSAGTPVNKKIGGNVIQTGSYANALSGSGLIDLGTLSAAAHTIKVQIYDDNSGNCYCRASSKADTESLQIRVYQMP